MTLDPNPCIPSMFEALRSFDVDGQVTSRLERLRLDELSPGEVVLRTRYAGVNYKDCLAICGQAKIISEFPRIAGIEAVGEVVESSSELFAKGSAALVHGFQTGIAFDGGFSEYMRIPAEHLQKLPENLSLIEAAVIGVPGFTVAMALEHFERQGVNKSDGLVAVTGASGAVGLLAITILSQAGYKVAAITRRMTQTTALRELGASEVIDAAVTTQPQRALEKPRFIAAIDNVGGSVLSWLLRSMQDGGIVACVGNVGGNNYEGSVLPFIMRRVQLCGIVANAPWPQRLRLWNRLASEIKPNFNKLMPHVRHLRLENLMNHAASQLKGTTGGRTLVTFDSTS